MRAVIEARAAGMRRRATSLEHYPARIGIRVWKSLVFLPLSLGRLNAHG
jgi:hypothetical protein